MIKNTRVCICLILLGIFFLIGCDDWKDVKKVDLSKTEEVKVTPHEPFSIRIGLIPEQDIRKMAARYEPLAKYLSKKLNVKVVLVYLDSYDEICDKFIYKQLDAAFFGSFSYALTHAKTGIEPIGRPDYNGTSVYRGLIVVREGSNIKNIADMKGKRLALVHQATYAGYLYPLHYFREQGINNVETYFSKISFAGSHDNAIFLLLRGEVDVATPKDLVYQRIVKENPDLEKKFIILSISGAVPSNALCVRSDFDPALKNKLSDALLGIHNDNEGEAKAVLESLGGVTRFLETSDADYYHLYETIKVLGIDLNTYPYYKRPDMGFNREAYEHDPSE